MRRPVLVPLLRAAIRPPNPWPPVQRPKCLSFAHPPHLVTAKGSMMRLTFPTLIGSLQEGPPTRRLGHVDPSSPVEKHFVLPPNIYSVFPPFDFRHLLV